jgi:sugar phosphate isomerase/epimerase
MKTRREFLKITVGSLFLADTVSLFGAEKQSGASWKIGICDWDVQAAGRVSSFAVAKELGFEGVQVSYQPNDPESLSNKSNRPKFLEAANLSGVSIASLCMGLLNDLPLATTPEAAGWVEDCLNTMVEMNIDQVLIPFFGNADMTQHNEHLPAIIEKFKRLAPVAEKNKKILAIESYLTAEEHLKLLDAIGSDAVKVYYDVRNSRNKNYDIFHEIELLGKNKLISQIHFKEDNRRLGEGDINFAKVYETLVKIDYNGWVVVESSSSGNWRESQIANAQFVKKLIGR